MGRKSFVDFGRSSAKSRLVDTGMERIRVMDIEQVKDYIRLAGEPGGMDADVDRIKDPKKLRQLAMEIREHTNDGKY